MLCSVRDVAVVMLWGPPSHGKSTLCRLACRYFKRPAYVSGEERHDVVRRRLATFGAVHTAVNPAESRWGSYDFIVLDSVQTLEYDSAKAWGYPPHVLISQVNAGGEAHGGMTIRHWCDADLMTQARLDADGAPTGRYDVITLKDRALLGARSWSYSLADLYSRRWPEVGDRRRMK